MIVNYEDLSNFAGQVAMVDGGFDPVHGGHLAYFRKARELGVPILCNVQSDRYITQVKKRATLLPEAQRAQLLDSLEHIDYVHICQTSTVDVLDRLKPQYYIKGNDWLERGLPTEEVELCNQNKVEIRYLDTVIDSSSQLADRYGQRLVAMGDREAVAELERFMSEQAAVESQHYDDQYFKGEWRAERNSYNIETRRRIEAKNPQNIKDVFQPETVLDVGCGPGALLLFMQELGLDVWGIDFSAAAREMAPDSVRDRITTASVTEYTDLGRQFDLVICREVLEHLTVRQVRLAAEVLARYTSKYLYVTTRYAQNPRSFIDAETDFDTDPSHITCLNKEFLRTIFVLEGLRSRPDLEQKMDWKNFGRVMVFEKI